MGINRDTKVTKYVTKMTMQAMFSCLFAVNNREVREDHKEVHVDHKDLHKDHKDVHKDPDQVDVDCKEGSFRL